MRVDIDVARFYESVPLDDGQEPPPGMPVHEMEDRDGVRRRAVHVLREGPSTTSIMTPPKEVHHAEHVAGMAAAGQEPDEAEEVVAKHVREVMRRHAPPREWTGLSCDDPDVEAYLRQRFGVKGGSKGHAGPGILPRDELQRLRDQQLGEFAAVGGEEQQG